MANLTRIEMETIIRRSDIDGYWRIYSDIPRDIRRIKAMAEGFGFQIHETTHGIMADVPLEALTFRKAPRRMPKLGEESPQEPGMEEVKSETRPNIPVSNRNGQNRHTDGRFMKREGNC